MNYFFAASSSTNNGSSTLTCNTALPAAGSSLATPSATSSSPTTPQDLELVIEIESSFHGVLLGMPEECPGAVLNATAILHVRKKPIRASKLMATFDGRIKVQCNDGATFGPEQYRERVLAHKDWVLWEAGANTHSASGSKNHIPVGTHYYPLSIQLDGALPPSFSGKHGSIRYILSSTLYRPLFYSDINSVQEIEIKRCLIGETSTGNDVSTLQHRSSHQDIGSMFLDHLARGALNPPMNSENTLTPAPTTITHHNTHKELLRYTASSPPIAYLEGGIIQIDLALEPLPPGSYIYSIAYGLKETIHYRSSATGNIADNKSETLYPVGQQTVIIPRDQERERSMSSAGAGASTRQLLELRACPLLTNVDTLTPLIEIQHKITCNVVVVLPDSLQRRNTISGSRSTHGYSRRDDQNSNGYSSGGGGILRRLNLAPQPLSPSLNLIDSTGADVANNAVLLGEPTQSIIEPALTPATVELNDAPPPPPSTRIENTILEFPIILTSRYPSPPRERSYDIRSFPVEEPLEGVERTEDDVHTPLGSSDVSEQPVIQFVHNQEIAPTIIPTTGTTVTFSESGVLSNSYSSASSLVVSSEQDSPRSSTSSSPPTPPNGQAVFPISRGSSLAPVQSGISAGLRAAAAASMSSNLGVDETRPTLSRPPSYGRPGVTPQEEPPKYEDVVESPEMLPNSGLGISIPRTIPSPVFPRPSPSPGSFSQQYIHPTSFSQSPVLHQSIPRGRFFASPPNPSHISPIEGSIAYDGQGSSPHLIRSHSRSGSSTSMLLSTSTSAMSVPMAHSPSSYGRQQTQHHQRQRSVGAATIMGSLGRNGGYLSQQPSSLTMTSCMLPTMTTMDRRASPPAYRAN
ncbi:Arrestin domain-containing protein 2 [Podila horticola]|nr:Arrestin domain-containing protein 2 [Podila horticola]